MFADGQTLTTTAVSENILDLGEARSLGSGETVNIQVNLSAAALPTTATVQVQVQGSAASDMSSAVVLAESEAKTVADYLEEGLALAYPRGIYRYHRLNFVVASGPLTAGTITAGLGQAGNDERIVQSAPGVYA
jgi:hypothetical protein